MDFMNTHGVTIYLKANSAFIYNRLLHAKAPRPLLKELKLDELLAFIEAKLAARQPYYLQSKLVQEMPLKSVETLVNTMLEQGL
jgi:shikimate kinase